MVLPLLLILAAAPSTQTWTFNTDGMPEVHIGNVDGAVRVDAVDGNDVVISVVWEGAESSRNEVGVEVVQKRESSGRGFVAVRVNKKRGPAVGAGPR